MSIYTFSKYLYIKQHSITGKLYFGVTSKNPEIYLGSGKRWTNHIKKHGKEHVVNLWYCLFLDQESCTEFALNFSNQENIVESNEWLNLTPENAKDGVCQTSATKDKISKALTGRTLSSETCHKIHIAKDGQHKGENNPNFGNNWSVEQKLASSTKMKGRVTVLNLETNKYESVSKLEYDTFKTTKYIGHQSNTVTAFDIELKTFVRIPKSEFDLLKNIKYVGSTHRIVNEFKTQSADCHTQESSLPSPTNYES
jgi:hypothetical protein